MKLYQSIAACLAAFSALFLICGPVLGQGNEPASEQNRLVLAPKGGADSNEPGIAAKVNGEPITEQEIQSELDKQMQRMASKGAKMPPKLMERYKQQIKQRILESKIIEKLIVDAMEEKNIVVTDEEVNKEIRRIADQQNMTVDDLKELIKAQGIDFEEWKKQMQFKKRIAFQKLIDQEYSGSVEVTEEKAEEYYKNHKEEFSQPERVQASHILIKPDKSDPNIDPNQAEKKAKEKAQKLLSQIKEEGADFATLAKAHSDCPSAEKGGDLGYGKKSDPNGGTRGSWVPPFEKAAFSLEEGQVSDVVKTQFGYHIIKVKGRKKAETRSFEEARDEIMQMLENREKAQLAQKCIESLKKEADIEYLGSYEAPPRQRMRPSPAGQGRSNTKGKNED